MKKFFIATLIVLTCLSIGGGIYWYSLQQTTTTSEAIDAIPTSATLVISYPNLTKAWDTFEEQDYYDILAPIDELQLFFSRNTLLDSLIRYDQEIKIMLADATIWSSYHSSKKDSLLVFHAIKPQASNERHIAETLKKVMTARGVVSEQKIGAIPIFKLVITEPYQVIYYTTYNGLILTSSSLNLMRESISQLNNGVSLKNDEEFVRGIKSAGKNVEANLFINYKRLPDYLSSILKPNIDTTDNPISNFASWTELDVNMKAEGITFNGFSYTNDTLNQYLNLFLDQQPQTITFPEILPSNTASFQFFGVDDVISFSSDYRKLLQGKGKLNRIEYKLDSLNAFYGIDLEQNLLSWMGNTFGICITEPQSESFAGNSYMVFSAQSSELAAKLLGDLSVTLAEKNKVDIEILDISGVEIRQLSLSGVLGEMFGEGFDAYANPYYMITNDHVIFGTTTESLAEYLQYIQADRTLGKELSFSRFAENLSSTFNIFSYHHLSRSKQIIESYLNRDAVEMLERNSNIAKSFEAIGSQISTTGSSFYSNVFLKYNPDWELTDESFWEAKMDAKAKTAPVFVKNHLNGEPEILVQDELNSLYLFNKVGQLLFKTELPEPIMSRPIQVDALKNGKLQYIFNTKNFIYLIDRNGKNVGSFPVELNSPAETSLSVFDYDKNNNYRLLITCKNKHIYNYDIKGNKISGWKHNRASDPTVHPFQHLSVRGKDYLITGESNGKIHLLDRRGKNRLKVKSRVVPSVNNHLQTFKSSEAAFTGIYITDKNGTIYRISLTGDVLPMELERFSPEHYFLVADLNKDGGPEFIFSDLNILQVFNYKKEKVFEQRVDPSATAPFIIDLGAEGKCIGYCYKDSEQLILFNSKGAMVDGFPQSGASKFDLFEDDENRLVVSANSGNSLMIQSLR